MKKTLILILMAFLLLIFPFYPANAALLNVTIKPGSVQIDSAGSTNLTVEVRNSSKALLNGAAVTLTASCAGSSFAPASGTSGPTPPGIFSSVFTGPATTSVVVCKITATATSGPDSGTATVSIIVGKGYVPLVPIPGVGTPTSFPAYLVGLYKLALISIAIFAMMMILYGGFKYMTSAGNPALMGDAKDAIWSAIFGLILALLSWLILSTVNPELTMIKTPGTSISAFAPSASTPIIQCAQEGELTSPTCNCVDGTKLPNPAPAKTCNSVCYTNNCYVADFRMGAMNSLGNSLPTDKDRAQKYATMDGSNWISAIPFSPYSKEGCYLAINAADYTTRFSDVISMKLDRGDPSPPGFDGICTKPLNEDLLAEPVPGYFGPTVTPLSCPLGAINSVYTQWEADTNCRKANTPTSVICPIKLCVTYTGGINRESIKYLRFIKATP